MYEQQTPFELADYIGLSYFLNNFLFKAIQENIFGNFKPPASFGLMVTINTKFILYSTDPRTVTSHPLFQSMHTLLLCLYRRDCRRSFAPPNHWLIHEIRPSHFLTDLEKGKKHTLVLLQKMPHIIPHEDRVKLFRKYVQNEKAVLGECQKYIGDDNVMTHLVYVKL